MIETLCFILFLGLCCLHYYVRVGKHFVWTGLIIPLVVVVFVIILVINHRQFSPIIYGQIFLNIVESILIVNQVRIRNDNN